MRPTTNKSTAVVAMAFVCAALLGVTSGGCKRQKTTPAADIQTETARPANQPVTVTGCLKAGEASDTFVLTSEQIQQGEKPATYQLIANEKVNLRDHIGERVEVKGLISAEREVATRSTTQEARRAKGTTGTPSVATQTELDVKQLQVSNVNPVGGQCGK